MKPTPRFPKPAPKPGVYYDIPADEYHQWAAVSSSMVKSMMGGPKVCHRFLHKPDGLPSAAMRFGTAVHAALFEPEVFMAAVEIDGLAPGAKPETFAKYAKEHGPLVLASGWRQQIRDICAAVESVPGAAELADGGRAEVCSVWEEPTEFSPVLCKCRMDYVQPTRLVELKTTDHRFLSPEAFASHAWRMGYHVQMAHQVAGFTEAFGDGPDEAAILAVSSTEPFDAVPFYPDDDWLGGGDCEWYRLLGRIAYCLKHDEWSGLAEGETRVTLSRPRWAMQEVEA